MTRIQIESVQGAQAKVDLARPPTPGALVGSFYSPQRVSVGRSEPVTINTKYNAAPGIFRLDSGKVGIVYVSKTNVSATDGAIKYRYKDNPETGSWTTEVTAASAPGSGYGGFWESAASVSSDGFVRISAYTSNGTVGTGCWLITSTSAGVIWNSPVLLPVTFSGYKALSAPLVDVGSGVWVQPVYGRNTGDTLNSVRVLRTTNYGSTWAEITIANGVADSTDYQDPYVVSIGSTLLILFRAGSGAFRRASSTDGGLTWTTHTAAFSPGEGRPSLLVTRYGSILATYRSTANRFIAARVSRDGGVTWTAEQLILQPESGVSSYNSQAVETAGGEYAVVGSVERSSGALADIRYLYLTEPGRTSKNADGTPVHRNVAALLDTRDIVAFDDLDRADEALLSYAPSGHRWEANIGAGHGLVSGKIVQAGASAAISVSTLQTYSADGSVSTSFKFPTGALCGVVFRYIDVNNFLYAAIDGAAGNITVYKIISGVSTQLGQNTGILPAAGATHPLKVTFRGNRVRVMYDGEKAVDVTLSGGEMSVFSAATKHGIRTFYTDQLVGPIVVGA